MEQVSILAALIGGLISFISPCVLPLVPAYISFVSGVSIDELQKGEDRVRILIKVSRRVGLFILGFSIVFILLGASATFVGQFMLEKLHVFAKIAGVIIVIFGLHLLGIFRIKFLNYEKRFQVSAPKLGGFSILLLGIAFAFGWTPCIGPILAAILALAATRETIWEGITLLTFYSLGLGIPFFLTGLAASSFLGMFQWFKRHFRAIEIISGAFLIVLGIMVFFEMFSRLSGYLIRWLPAISNIG